MDYASPGSTAVATNDFMVKVTNITLGTTAADLSGGFILGKPASTIVKAVLPVAPLLDQSTDAIVTSSFQIPHFASIDGGRTPREYISAANAYEDNVTKVIPGRRLVFKPKPTSPTATIGTWPGSEFTDAASNSSEEIYNKVVVEGTGPDGQSLRVPRYAASTSMTKTSVTSMLTNPGFATATTGWSVNAGSTLTRSTTTGTPMTPPYGVWVASATTSILTGAIFGTSFTFVAGVKYTLTIDTYSANTSSYALSRPSVKFGTSGDFATVAGAEFDPVNRLYTTSIAWIPAANAASSTVSVRLGADAWPSYPTNTLQVNNVTVSYDAGASLPDRRGFVRTKRLQVNAPITLTTGQQLGDIFLSNHYGTPLKGDVSIVGGGARDYSSGRVLHPSELLLQIGELMHLSHRVDPDTGAHGRDGRMSAVSYEHNTQTAKVSLDNQRNRFEALLERLAVVTNNRLGR